jgi:hypothetical protein
MSHTLYTATQTAPQNMTPTDQPSAPQIRHPRSPGSENWGSHCHLYPADEHNQITVNEPSLFDIISSQLEWTNDARTTLTSCLRKCAIVATHYSCM